MENKLQTMKIKGKDYVQVHERVRYFNDTFENGFITTEVSYEENFVRCKATVIPDSKEPSRCFTGHCEEDRSQGMVNKTNATENAETGAVGRALGFMGIGIIASIASADEVVGAIAKQEQPTYVPVAQEEQGKVCPGCGKMFPGKFPLCYPCNMKKKAPAQTTKPAKDDEPPFDDITF